jgi:hypothetical protein
MTLAIAEAAHGPHRASVRPHPAARLGLHLCPQRRHLCYRLLAVLPPRPQRLDFTAVRLRSERLVKVAAARLRVEGAEDGRGVRLSREGLAPALLLRRQLQRKLNVLVGPSMF